MLKLIIEDDEGRKTVVPFVRDEITIGRQEGNTIRLTERNVSRRHARLIRSNGTVLVEDLGSYNGIRVNGHKISGQSTVRDGDLIQIGDYDLALALDERDKTQPPPPPVPTVAPAAPPAAAPATMAPPPAAPSQAGPTDEVPVEELEPEPTTDGNGSLPEGVGADFTSRQTTSIIRREEITRAIGEGQGAELDKAEAPRLVILNTEFAGKEFSCIRTDLMIGRAEENDISIGHRSLSRVHARLTRDANGEWKVIDLQSANGISVNDEAYAQATLRSGDLLQLGYVKTKFLGPGEVFNFVPGAYEGTAVSPRPSRGSWLWGAVALLFIVAGVGLWWSRSEPEAPPRTNPRIVVAPQPTAEEVTAPVEVPPTPSRPPELTPAQNAELGSKLKAARAAIAAKAFDRAVQVLDSLSSLKGLDPVRDREIENLFDQARGELLMKEKIDLASRALSQGKLEDAVKRLEESEGTQAFSGERQKLREKLEEALAKAARDHPKKPPPKASPPPPAPRPEKVAPPPPAPRPEKVATPPPAPRPEPTPPPPKVEPAPVDDSPQKLFEEGTAVFRKKQFAEAKGLFTRCVDMDPNFAPCHKMLGTTYANLRDPEMGAKHYRLFLKLAPNDKDAAKVKLILDEYDARK